MQHSALNPYTVLVAGAVCDQASVSRNDAGASEALCEVIRTLKNHLNTEDFLCEILTGVRTSIDVLAAELAHQETLSFSLLAIGKPCQLTELQKLAQRQIWLGADVDDIKTGQPQSIWNEVALGYTDILLVVWDGVTIDDEVVPLLLSAALAMKPVIWIDVTGVVRVLQRELLTKAQRHLLQCPCSPIQSLVSCFSSPIALQNPTQFLQAITDPVSLLDSSAHQRDAFGKSRAGTVHKFMMALVQGRFKKAFSTLAASNMSSRDAAKLSKLSVLSSWLSP